MAVDRRNRQKTSEERVDDTVEDSFPASDPPSYSGVTGTGQPGSRQHHPPASSHRGDDARPTGTPNSDRHSTETSHQWEDEMHPQQKHPG